MEAIKAPDGNNGEGRQGEGGETLNLEARNWKQRDPVVGIGYRHR